MQWTCRCWAFMSHFFDPVQPVSSAHPSALGFPLVKSIYLLSFLNEYVIWQRFDTSSDHIPAFTPPFVVCVWDP